MIGSTRLTALVVLAELHLITVVWLPALTIRNSIKDKMKSTQLKNDYQLWLCILILVSCYAFLTPALWKHAGTDWNGSLAPAARLLLAGKNPYLPTLSLEVPGTMTPPFYNPIWVLLPMIPLALLPHWLGLILMYALTLAAYIFLGIQMKAKPLALTAFLLSPAVLLSFHQLNIDAFVLLGFLLPAPIGLFFAIAKPQIGIGMILYWLIEAWRLGGIRKVIITFAPVTISLAITFILYGNWFSTVNGAGVVNAVWNYSIFPWGIPIGAILLYLAFQVKKKYLGASSGPFLTPYLGLYSWLAALVGFFEDDRWMLVAVILMWIYVALRGGY